MHIPDGFLSAPVWGAFDVLALPALGIAARRAQRGLDERNVPLLGVMGAFVFAAQMINFPVGPGTSGHLVGAALLAIALGPAAASVVMTSILAIQALVFQDGGILSLGANIFNMAIAGVLAGYLPYRLLAHAHRASAIFLGGVLSVLVSAAFAFAELAASGVPMPRRLLLLSMGFFLVGALVEGAITLAAVGAMERLNPHWLRAPEQKTSPALRWIAAAALLLAVAGILIASRYPDGIEHLAAPSAPAWLHAPLAGYRVHGIESPWLRRSLAGAAGLILIYGACLFAGRLISRRSA
ncbi:MAG TPA: energy-coupling factor ABC transporter permease [Bryobacteraceae bacterium]|jgi:cobalt/nickel transport system permease protein|nr:energy-coupling factor ABC transporter permease [Bryobacteraceae bacterium]